MSSTLSTTSAATSGAIETSRLVDGALQLSSNAWGSVSVSKIRQSIRNLVIYQIKLIEIASDEVWEGSIPKQQYRNSLAAPEAVICATKWCVFKRINVSRAVVLSAVQERLERTGTNRLDILQAITFHWNDYSDKGYLTALRILQDIKSEGLISAVGLVNFDAIRTDEICTQLGHGAIVSNQVQFSIIDTRPLHGMADVCDKHDVKLLTYGTLCGGFLADKWLHQPEPDLYSGDLTPSSTKVSRYDLQGWGTWELFQTLLATLRAIGDRHQGLSIANVATRWVLDHPFVAAVIIGLSFLNLYTARLGISEHPDENRRVFGFNLTEQDKNDIEAVLLHSNGRKMITTIGYFGAEYRSVLFCVDPQTCA
ncbi:Aldo/keto reductase [Tricholoma matsutake]|nr:Aldo/keto reductase [Tricholoma matsutake 945]